MLGTVAGCWIQWQGVGYSGRVSDTVTGCRAQWSDSGYICRVSGSTGGWFLRKRKAKPCPLASCPSSPVGQTIITENVIYFAFAFGRCEHLFKIDSN